MIFSSPGRLLAGALILGFASVPAWADTIRTKAPQEHIDAFMTNCKANNVPNATCVCMVKKLSETREGDAALDMLGLMKYRQSEAERKAGILPLLNRHGLRATELKAIAAPGNPLLQNVARQCT